MTAPLNDRAVRHAEQALVKAADDLAAYARSCSEHVKAGKLNGPALAYFEREEREALEAAAQLREFRFARLPED